MIVDYVPYPEHWTDPIAAILGTFMLLSVLVMVGGLIWDSIKKLKVIGDWTLSTAMVTFAASTVLLVVFGISSSGERGAMRDAHEAHVLSLAGYHEPFDSPEGDLLAYDADNHLALLTLDDVGEGRFVVTRLDTPAASR